MNSEIKLYHEKLSAEDSQLCELLYSIIDVEIPNSESKVWHGHPVWFINGNPIVGYSKLKAGIQLLFWSGQSFDEMSLKNTGKFKAAYLLFEDQNVLNVETIQRCLRKSVKIQWDYLNIIKNRGILNRIS
jgi:hypothetical protein